MADLLDDFLDATAAPLPERAEAPAPESCPVLARRRGLVITTDRALVGMLESLWPAEAVGWQVFSRAAQAMEQLYAEPPDLLLLDEDLPDMSGLELAATVKSENVYRQMPVVVALNGAATLEAVNWALVEADDFLLRPFSASEIKARLTLTLARATRTLDANPLSKLPGNTSIIQRIQDLIDTRAAFGLAYVDLDNFKSFNDKYGFSRGDEALMMSSRLLVNVVREQPLLSPAMNFVGHVGGDDFVFILPADQIEAACQAVCARFDAIVPSFYDEEDRRRGGIRSTDRQGNVRDFPFMSVSIAVVINYNAKLTHAGEAASMAASLKKKAKGISGSVYVVDQRLR